MLILYDGRKNGYNSNWRPSTSQPHKFVLSIAYHGQKADKMKASRSFARENNESLQEVHTRLKRLMSTMHGATK
jgi:hypothetical protein